MLIIYKFLWPLKEMSVIGGCCNEPWLQHCDISIASLPDNFLTLLRLCVQFASSVFHLVIYLLLLRPQSVYCNYVFITPVYGWLYDYEFPLSWL